MRVGRGGARTTKGKTSKLGAFDWFLLKRWAGCACWSVHSWSMHSMLMQPWRLVSQCSCVSGAWAVLCTATPSNLIVQ
ncbi:hypothetical protein IEO21_10099 [Rhodonia placenta]|uniref:Uncharacterized protein n=1 Tax=Rhodonia placenta TaxID=104341 RepID=A0A8H7NT27_9APHY|nr:hypothetical protein IEO21_10099 [Postia placenta]